MHYMIMYGKKYKPKRKKMKNETAKMYMYAKYTINCWPYLRKEYYNQHYSITTLKKHSHHMVLFA